MKNCKTFYKAQTVSRLKEISSFHPTHTPSYKILLCLWNKNVLTEIYRNIKTFAFKVLQEYSSWASKNGAVQMFFFDTKQKHVCWKIFRARKLCWLCCGSVLFSMSVELRFVKWVRLFKWNCVVKWVVFR